MKRKLLNGIIILFDRFLNKFGYEVELDVKRIIGRDLQHSSLNLNIGAGDYVIAGFKSLDFYSPHYYPDKRKFLKDRIEYDIRRDTIPFDNDSVDNIYISHVIEHIETEHVVNLFRECYRVLKKGGVLRVACPDAKFLFEVSQFENSFWTWRHPTVSGKEYNVSNLSEIHRFDFLIRELSTSKCKIYNNAVESTVLSSKDCEGLPYSELIELARESVVFRDAFPGDHINIWDFERLELLGKEVGFAHVIESKQHGSVSASMQGCKFDKKAPQMSLYVDLVR